MDTCAQVIEGNAMKIIAIRLRNIDFIEFVQVLGLLDVDFLPARQNHTCS